MGKILGEVRDHFRTCLGSVGAHIRHAGPWLLGMLLPIGMALLLWGTAHVPLGQPAAPFRPAVLANALHAAGDEVSRTPFPITAETVVTLRPARCAGTAKAQRCYEVQVTTPSGTRAPSVHTRWTVAVDTTSGAAVVEHLAAP